MAKYLRMYVKALNENYTCFSEYINQMANMSTNIGYNYGYGPVAGNDKLLKIGISWSAPTM